MLEQLPKAPEIQAERSCPLAHAPFGKVRECALRVLVYNERNRVAVEFFHYAIVHATSRRHGLHPPRWKPLCL